MSKKEDKNQVVRHNKLRSVLECILQFLLLVLLTALGCILDLAYQGILDFGIFACLLDQVKRLLRFSGLSHADLWDFITSNTGVLIALVSMFFTFTIDIYERSEKKVFGISRKELTNKKHDRLYKGFSRMAAMSPLLMLVYVVFGFCAGCYLLLLLSYVFLLVIYGRHRSSYEGKREQENLCNKLLELARGGMQAEGIKTYWEYKDYLVSIYEDVRKENNWFGIQALYFKFLDVLKEQEDEICFIAEYYFVMIVFDQRNQTHDFDFFQVLESYLDSVKYDGNYGDMDKKDVVLLWGMLAASIPYAQEKELIDFLEFFSDFEKRIQSSIRITGKEISASDIERQCVVILVFLETWLRLHEVTRKELLVYARKIYLRGKGAFFKNDLFQFDDLYFWQENMGDESINVINILVDFGKEKRLGLKISLIANLIEII